MFRKNEMPSVGFGILITPMVVGLSSFDMRTPIFFVLHRIGLITGFGKPPNCLVSEMFLK